MSSLRDVDLHINLFIIYSLHIYSLSYQLFRLILIFPDYFTFNILLTFINDIMKYIIISNPYLR